MEVFKVQTGARIAVSILLTVSTLALGACQKDSASLDPYDTMSTASTGSASISNTAALGKAWQADPKNIDKGVAYANGLEALGQTDQQLGVLQQLNRENPGNSKLSTLYGKKLLSAGKISEALPVLEQAAATSEADWRVHSALGSVYDQQGQYDKARAEYDKALAFKPNELSVLNNTGMSYALQGNLKKAESVFRQASQIPGSQSQPRIRQNLALVVGLQGRFDEARKIASEDLPPDQVEANLAYLQKMLSQPNTWQQITNDQG